MDGRQQSKVLEDVLLWQKARAWVVAVYRYTERFPKHEVYGMTAQLRDAAVSVPSNFAEGLQAATWVTETLPGSSMTQMNSRECCTVT
jgi:four helix bundle protein